MANPIKQLAGETAVYGLSTILARIINFLFVPFYTRLLTTESYGVVAEFMAYIAVLQVVLVLGMETGCFRFANKENANPKVVYSNALALVSGVSMAFLALMVAFSGTFSAWLGYAGYESCIIYMGGILAMDSVTAILFAKLRQEHKAFRFAALKTVKIITETAVNILLFFPFVSFCAGKASAAGVPVECLGPDDVWLLHFVSPAPDFSYVIFAIFVSCLVCMLLFVPSLLKFSFEFDGKLLRQMLLYSVPLMVAALPGVVNDFLDRILFRFFDTSADAWRSSVGIYQAAVKLSVIMSLFIQMFRFAAEPFFFQRARDKGSKELYAKVMEYFTAFCGLVFLGVILYIDVISLVLGKDFREGIGIVPIMLLSYMLLGMLFNVSMWYKLSGKTSMAIYITVAGLAVTAVVNIVFMPLYSYWAAAAAHLASYAVMFVISAALGQRHYPIPYRWGRISFIFIGMGIFYALSLVAARHLFIGADFADGLCAMVLKLAFNTLLVVAYCAYSYFLLKPGGRLQAPGHDKK
ncbi:MAG: oligosaccharide flippase family protein [Bacteroidales bacterium]|nr:oligosaccharide flippase family protein [Bacteroidales bacterium]